MFSHVVLGARDVSRMATFYDAVFACLGIDRVSADANGAWVAWRRPGTNAAFYVGLPFDGQPATTGNGSMNAFLAPSHETVRASHAAALAAGGSDAGPPGMRPQYAADYYGAYMRDPEGNKLHVVHRQGNHQ